MTSTENLLSEHINTGTTSSVSSNTKLYLSMAFAAMILFVLVEYYPRIIIGLALLILMSVILSNASGISNLLSGV